MIYTTYSASYPIQNFKKYRLYFLDSLNFLTVDFNEGNLELENVSLKRRNYTQNFFGFSSISMFVYNPLNSSDWSTDPSWYIKTTSASQIEDTEMNLSLYISLDKFSFNINETYCNPIFEAREFNPYLDNITIFTEILDFSGK